MCGLKALNTGKVSNSKRPLSFSFIYFSPIINTYNLHQGTNSFLNETFKIVQLLAICIWGPKEPLALLRGHQLMSGGFLFYLAKLQ